MAVGPGPAVHCGGPAVMYFITFWAGVCCTILALLLWAANTPEPKP